MQKCVVLSHIISIIVLCLPCVYSRTNTYANITWNISKGAVGWDQGKAWLSITNGHYQSQQKFSLTSGHDRHQQFKNKSWLLTTFCDHHFYQDFYFVFYHLSIKKGLLTLFKGTFMKKQWKNPDNLENHDYLLAVVIFTTYNSFHKRSQTIDDVTDVINDHDHLTNNHSWC